MVKKSTKVKIEKLNTQFKELCIHFDTQEHQISIEQFEQTILAYKTITSDIAANVFDVKCGLKIYILPPKNGGFEIFFKIIAEHPALSAIAGAIGYDALKGFVKGITKNINNRMVDGFTPELGAEILGETVQGFISETSLEINELETKLISETNKRYNFDVSKKAKADFFNSCSKNNDIKGIGFTEKHEFPIKRCDFTERSIPPRTKPLPEKQELKELIIVKSVNTEEKLQWDFKDLNTKESFSANIEDEDFNAKLLSGQCPLKKKSTPDIIIALVEFRKKLENGKERKDSYIVREVYKFNNKKLKERPKNLRLNRPKKQKDNSEQLNLFKNTIS